MSDLHLTMVSCKTTTSGLDLGRILLLLLLLISILKKMGHLIIIGAELPHRYRVWLGIEIDVLVKEYSRLEFNRNLSLA